MITLQQAKKQCRIEADMTEEDDLLEGYIAAATRHAHKYLNRNVYEGEVPESDPDGITNNKSIDQAILLLVGYWYANREAASDVTMTEVPLAFKSLLTPDRNMGV